VFPVCGNCSFRCKDKQDTHFAGITAGFRYGTDPSRRARHPTPGGDSGLSIFTLPLPFRVTLEKNE
jgi:hypothetical protein